MQKNILLSLLLLASSSVMMGMEEDPKLKEFKDGLEYLGKQKNDLGLHYNNLATEIKDEIRIKEQAKPKKTAWFEKNWDKNAIQKHGIKAATWFSVAALCMGANYWLFNDRTKWLDSSLATKALVYSAGGISSLTFLGSLFGLGKSSRNVFQQGMNPEFYKVNTKYNTRINGLKNMYSEALRQANSLKPVGKVKEVTVTTKQ